MLFAAQRNREFFDDRKAEAEASREGWCGPAWGFVCYLRSRPELDGLSGLQTAAIIEEALEELRRSGRLDTGDDPEGVDPWLCALPGTDSFDDEVHPAEHFTEAWSREPDPLVESPLDRALRLADAYPLRIESPRLPTHLQESLPLLASVAYWLQRTAGMEPFFLSARQAAAILGSPARTAARQLVALRDLGLLQLVAEGTRKDRQASTYRFDLAAVGIRSNEDSAIRGVL